jgi:hypothetical protein
MSGGTLPAGTSTYSSTIAAAGTAEATTFADRYGYVVVQNTSATAGQILYVRADSTAATVGGQGCLAVPAGGQVIIANGLLLWYQSSKVIQKGSNQFGGGNTADSPSSPGMIQSQDSLAGQMANPGTTVSVISSTLSLPYTLAGTG